jgi:hypothetical protein
VASTPKDPHLLGDKSLITTAKQLSSFQSTTALNPFVCLFFVFIIIFSGLRLRPLGAAAIIALLYQPQMIDDDDCGATGGIKIGRGNRSTRRKPASTPLCPPQIPHGETRTRIRAVAVGNQRLTT